MRLRWSARRLKGRGFEAGVHASAVIGEGVSDWGGDAVLGRVWCWRMAWWWEAIARSDGARD